MTSRERVLAALDHREPDRVPVDFSGHRSSGIAAIAYARLRAHLGFDRKPLRVYDPIQQLAVVDEDVLEWFGVDTTELGRAFATGEECWADWTLPDGTPCRVPVWVRPERGEGGWVIRSARGRVIARMPDGALYFEQAYYPFADREWARSDGPCEEEIREAFQECMWTAVASPPGPLAAGPDGDRVLAEGAERLRKGTDRAIVGLFGGNLLEMGQFLFRNDRFLEMLAGEPDRTHAFLDRLVEIHLVNLERFLRQVGPHLDVIVFGDDLGMQTGPQMSPAMYREFFKPRHRRMWRRAKALTDARVMLHCCGGVRELLPDLIDAGLDAINPVQVTCRGMGAQGLKADFGREITFWGGGCDTREILCHGHPEAVRAHVREQVQTLSPGGGYVFQQVHNILADVPPQNVEAMFGAVQRTS